MRGSLYKRDARWYVSVRNTYPLGVLDADAARTRHETMPTPPRRGTTADWVAYHRAMTCWLEHGTQTRVDCELAHVWDAYLASPRRPDTGASTLGIYAAQWGAFVDWCQEKGVLLLTQVNESVAERYMNHLLTRVGKNTWNKHLSLLKLVCKVMRVNPSPFAGIPNKIPEKHTHRALSTPEMERVLARARGEIETFLLLGLYSGLRLVDCATLQWSEVDLATGRITRTPRKTGRKRPDPVLIPIHPRLALHLYERVREDGDVLPATARRYARDRSAVSKAVKRVFGAAHVHANGTGKAGFHSLRHTFVTLMHEAGAPAAVVEAIVGHATTAMNQRYTHIGFEAAQRAVALLPEVGRITLRERADSCIVRA